MLSSETWVAKSFSTAMKRLSVYDVVPSPAAAPVSFTILTASFVLRATPLRYDDDKNGTINFHEFCQMIGDIERYNFFPRTASLDLMYKHSYYTRGVHSQITCL